MDEGLVEEVKARLLAAWESGNRGDEAALRVVLVAMLEKLEEIDWGLDMLKEAIEERKADE